jgi:hypothetical protein
VSNLELRVVNRDDKEIIQMKCPGCAAWGDVDKQQQTGLVSCICPECRAHWTVQIEEIEDGLENESN